MKLKDIKVLYFITVVSVIILIVINVTMYLKFKDIKRLALNDEYKIEELTNSILYYKKELPVIEEKIDNYKLILGEYYSQLESYDKTKKELYELLSKTDNTRYNLNEQIKIIEESLRNACPRKFSDVREVFKYLDYTKSEILNEFGQCKLQTIREGFKAHIYSEIGLTFAFYKGEQYEEVLFIMLDHNINIDGVSSRMNLYDIKYYLSSELNKEVEIVRNPNGKFVFSYEIDNFIVWFYSYDEDGKLSRVEIYK